MSEQDSPDIHLRVLYDFEYTTKDGRKINIKEGEKLFLIKKANLDWWQVIRSSAERPFYVPSKYVEEYSWSPGIAKEMSRRTSVKKAQEKKLNVPAKPQLKNLKSPLKNEKEDSVQMTDNKKSSCSSIESDTYAPVMDPSKQQILESAPKKEKSSILLDKRKSWAVEELVAELSKMRSERNELSDLNQSGSKHPSEENLISGENIMHNSVCIPVTSDDKFVHLRKTPLSMEKDNTDNALHSNLLCNRSSHEENISRSGVYSVVYPASSPVPKNVGKVKLSESLEKLAQQIQFDPAGTSSSRSTPTKLSRSLDEHTVPLDDSNLKMDSVFSRMKSKLGYSSSFKTKKELQQVMKRGVGNSVLSTSWEMSLSEPDSDKKKRQTIQNEKELRTSRNVLESVKGEAKVLDGQIKPFHSGSELDVIEQRSDSKKSPSQSWNLLRNKVRNGKLKKIVCASESESEEYLDESVGLDEDSVSGLSDDNLLFQSSTSKIYSDISDGAISDDLFIESADNSRDSDGHKNHSGSQRRKVSLTRGSRVESHGIRHYSSPPSPSPGLQATRALHEGWEEYQTPQGRTFYYNRRTRDKSWKPPRRQHRHSNENAEDGSIENLRSDSSSPLAEANGSCGTSYVPVPKGWREAYDEDTCQPCYVNDATGAKWFSSNDSQGRIYFFEENSNESSWTLPEIAINVCDTSTPAKSTPKDQQPMGAKKPAKEEKQLEGDVQLRSDPLGTETEAKVQYRMAKAHSMALLESTIGKQASSKSSSIPRNWPDWTNGEMCVLKEATLNRTKITENGKKLRKNWAPAHVVLTEPFLLFFKDAKTFSAMKNPQGESSSAARPEFTVDLNGALLENGEKASSRRNVFLVSTVLGLQVLLQCENSTQADEWYQAIHKAITDLPSAYDSCPRNKTPKLSPPYLGSHSPDEFKKSSRIGRSRSVKSVKLSTKDGSLEDLTVSPDENQTKIKNRLKKFFHRRPTKEVLVKKGIYKDEPVFGCLLSDVCKGESPRVPQFVQRCVAAIECKEENMKTDGLYRASGNLSQVQKIRLQVDQNNLAILEQEEDVHVLTGTLKLFFRELKKPLIPFEHFNKALKASMNHNKKEKLQQFREIVKALPHPNRDTLEFLLRHLLRVTGFQEFNRMHIPNLAIVFGPTLMWPEAESQNMALDLMQQNLVIECFLQEFESIFR